MRLDSGVARPHIAVQCDSRRANRPPSPSVTAAMHPNQTASPSVASVDETRSNFPALDRLHNGLPVAYFDGPGGTQTPRSVVDAMTDYLYRHNANTHWNYPTSAETDAMIARSRSAMADFLGAIAHGDYLRRQRHYAGVPRVRALGRTFEPGDEIVVTELDHHANVDPWRALHRERGCVIRPVKMNLPPANSTGAILSRKSRAKPSSSPSAPHRTHWARLTIYRERLNWHIRSALWPSSTRCITPRIIWSTSMSGLAIFSCARPTSSTGRTLARCIVGVNCSSRCRLPGWPGVGQRAERAETGTLNHEGMAGCAAAVDFLASLRPAKRGANRCAMPWNRSTNDVCRWSSKCGRDWPKSTA